MSTPQVFFPLKQGLIISCNRLGNEPFTADDMLLLFARAGLDGGAAGIRAEGAPLVSLIKQNLPTTVIGWCASTYDDGRMRVSGSFQEVESLLHAGADIIAIDGTFRRRDGMSGPQYVEAVRQRFNCPLLVDVSTYAEGIACADYGADGISTYLSGGTLDTSYYDSETPDFNIVRTLTRELTIPVIADGRILIPKFAKDLLLDGAWSVVIEAAVTKPKIITGWFLDAVQKAREDQVS